MVILIVAIVAMRCVGFPGVITGPDIYIDEEVRCKVPDGNYTMHFPIVHVSLSSFNRMHVSMIDARVSSSLGNCIERESL